MGLISISMSVWFCRESFTWLDFTNSKRANVEQVKTSHTIDTRGQNTYSTSRCAPVSLTHLSDETKKTSELWQKDVWHLSQRLQPTCVSSTSDSCQPAVIEVNDQCPSNHWSSQDDWGTYCNDQLCPPEGPRPDIYLQQRTLGFCRQCQWEQQPHPAIWNSPVCAPETNKQTNMSMICTAVFSMLS